MPRFLSKYLKKQVFLGCQEVYFIFTSGGYCGIAGSLAKAIFQKKQMQYLGHAEFTMPRNYMISNSYPMLAPDAIRERLLQAHDMLDPVADSIWKREPLTARQVQLFETLITVPFNPVWSKLMLKADGFYTTDQCVGCKKCARLCPLNNITILDQKPVWGKHCTHCMACIGNCPTGSIRYKNVKQSKDQYNFGLYRHFLKESSDSDRES